MRQTEQAFTFFFDLECIKVFLDGTDPADISVQSSSNAPGDEPSDSQTPQGWSPADTDDNPTLIYRLKDADDTSELYTISLDQDNVKTITITVLQDGTPVVTFTVGVVACYMLIGSFKEDTGSHFLLCFGSPEPPGSLF